MDIQNRVLILGATGMLGSTIFNYFTLKSGFDVWGTYRGEKPANGFIRGARAKIIPFQCGHPEYDVHRFLEEVRPAVIINCIGIIKQRAEAEDVLSAVPINTLLPHQLQTSAEKLGAKLVHISTDCVFSGTRGYYLEQDTPDAFDVYGLSKYLGEVKSKNSLTLRTSIIGHELGSKMSLLEWFLSQKKQIYGYTDAYFSGLPTSEVAKVILDILTKNIHLSGLYHLSANRISKYDLLSIINKVYGKNLDIIPCDRVKLDRSLQSHKLAEHTSYKTKPWYQLIFEMKEFKDECNRYF